MLLAYESEIKMITPAEALCSGEGFRSSFDHLNGMLSVANIPG